MIDTVQDLPCPLLRNVFREWENVSTAMLLSPRVSFAGWYHSSVQPSTHSLFKHFVEFSSLDFCKWCKSDEAFCNSKVVFIKSNTFLDPLVIIKSYKSVFPSFLCVSAKTYNSNFVFMFHSDYIRSLTTSNFIFLEGGGVGRGDIFW